MGAFDRFSLRPVLRDHWRSLAIHASGKPDRVARGTLYLLPAAAGLSVFAADIRIPASSALTAPVALLSAVLLAAVGQMFTIRGRVADSPFLALNDRVTRYLREAVSGTLIAAVVALFDAVDLAVLSALPRTAPQRLGAFFSAVAAALTVYLILVFVSTVRRTYVVYLEAFEGGKALEKPRERPPAVSPAPASDTPEVRSR